MTGLERIFCAIHSQADGCGRVVFLARFSGPFDQAAIEHALSNVTKQCEQAAVRVVRTEDGRFEFRIADDYRVPVIGFQSVKNVDHGSEVAIAVGREQFPPGEEPSLRWVVLRSEADDTFQIVGLAHHALFDAFSMALLLRRFLESLGNHTVPEWRWPMPPLPRGEWKTFWDHYKRSIPRSFKQRQLKRVCPKQPRDSDSTGACVIQRWTADETTALTNACRKAGTTVTALLGAAGTQTVHTRMDRDWPVVDLVIPVNLRRYLPDDVAEQSIGNLVVVRNFATDFRQPTGLAEEAVRIANQLKDYVAHQSPLRVYHSVNLVVPQRFKIPVNSPVMVSANSLGRFDFPTAPLGVRMLECGWFANGGTHMPVLSQSAATVEDRLSITSYSVWIAPSQLRLLALEVDRLLRQFAGLNSPPATRQPS